MTRCAAEAGARLHLATERGELEELSSIVGAGDRLRFLSQQLHGEMMREVRWTPHEAERTRDGIDVATLELDGADLAGIQLARRWENLAFLRHIGGGKALEEGSRKAVVASSAMGCLTITGTDPLAYFVGGRAMQRLWLTATSLGLAVQPMTTLLYLFARLERGDGTRLGLDSSELKTLRGLRSRLAAVFARRSGEAELLLFRLTFAEPPSARSLRRDVDCALHFENRVACGSPEDPPLGWGDSWLRG